MALALSYRVQADWNRDFLFTHAQSTLANVERVDYSYGLAAPYEEVAQPSQMIVTLNNSDGRYFVEEASSPLLGVFRKNVLMRLQGFFSGQWRTFFSGSLTALEVDPKENPPKQARLIVSDPFGRLEEAEYSPPLQINVRTDQALLALFESGVIVHPYIHKFWLVGVPGSSEVGTTTTVFQQNSLSVDTGQTTLAFVGDNADEGFGISALGFARDVVAAEAGGRLIFDPKCNLDNFGAFHFWDRHHLSASGNVLQISTLILDDPPPVYHIADDIINSVEINYEIREQGAAGTVLYAATSVMSVPAGETRRFKARYRNPDVPNARVGGMSMIQPAAGFDYVGNSQSDGLGSVQTASLGVHVNFHGDSADVSITNQAAITVYLTTFQLRGTPLFTYERASVTDSDPVSIAAYGLFKRVLNLNFVSDSDFVKNYAHSLISRFSQPIGRLERVTLRDASTLTEGSLLGHNVQCDLPDVNNAIDDYVIVGVQHQLVQASGDDLLTFILEPRPRSTFWTVGVPGSSEIGVSSIVAL